MRKVKSCLTDFEAEVIYRLGHPTSNQMRLLYEQFLDDRKIYDCVEWIEGNMNDLLVWLYAPYGAPSEADMTEQEFLIYIKNKLGIKK